MKDGFEDIATPYNTTEWEELVASVRAHHNGNSTRILVVAADLRRMLPKAINVRGRSGWGGIDLRIAAIQLARQINHASAAEIAAAAAWTKADQIFHGNFAAQPGGAHRGQFDGGK